MDKAEIIYPPTPSYLTEAAFKRAYDYLTGQEEREKRKTLQEVIDDEVRMLKM